MLNVFFLHLWGKQQLGMSLIILYFPMGIQFIIYKHSPAK